MQKMSLIPRPKQEDLMRKSILLALTTIVISGAAQADTAITRMFCEGSVESNGLEAASKIMILVQKIYPTGKDQVQLSINGVEKVSEEALVAATLNSVQSAQINLGISYERVGFESIQHVSLNLNKNLVKTSYLECKKM